MLQIKKIGNRPNKSGNYDSRYTFKIFNIKNKTKTKTPNVKNNQKYIRRPQMKKFYKTDPS